MPLDGFLSCGDGGDEGVRAGEAGEHGEDGGGDGEEVVEEGFVGVGFRRLDGACVAGEGVDVGGRKE